jgi:hypothetical protein
VFLRTDTFARWAINTVVVETDVNVPPEFECTATTDSIMGSDIVLALPSTRRLDYFDPLPDDARLGQSLHRVSSNDGETMGHILEQCRNLTHHGPDLIVIRIVDGQLRTYSLGITYDPEAFTAQAEFTVELAECIERAVQEA